MFGSVCSSWAVRFAVVSSINSGILKFSPPVQYRSAVAFISFSEFCSSYVSSLSCIVLTTGGVGCLCQSGCCSYTLLLCWCSWSFMVARVRFIVTYSYLPFLNSLVVLRVFSFS